MMDFSGVAGASYTEEQKKKWILVLVCNERSY